MHTVITKHTKNVVSSWQWLQTDSLISRKLSIIQEDIRTTWQCMVMHSMYTHAKKEIQDSREILLELYNNILYNNIHNIIYFKISILSLQLQDFMQITDF